MALRLASSTPQPMKPIHAIALAAVCAALASCIKQEAPNAECDILAVDTAWVTQHRSVIIGEPIVTNDHVSFNIQKGTDRSAFAPRFILTPGATISPANGTSRDFSTPQTYTVSSEDGQWQKAYAVSFNFPQPITTCSFEHYELDKSGRYNVWYEVDAADTENPRRDYWSSGNAGYAMTGMATQVTGYPTSAVSVGYKGNGVRLTTLATGSFGENLPDPMPIAAGSIFIGEFRTAYATLYPRRATRFGLQLVGGRPLYLEGYYKYTAGPTVIDKYKNVLTDRRDSADIYAVVYEVDPTAFVPLNGDDVLTSDRIVAMARIDDPGEPADWTRFKEPFRLRNGKTFNEERLKDDGYAIAIVATSSRAGAYFEGAVGSTLYIDELHIVWEGDDEEE